MRISNFLILAALLAAIPAVAATTCENLASVALPNAKIDSAQMVAAGAFVQPGAAGQRANQANPFAKLPAFCAPQSPGTWRCNWTWPRNCRPSKQMSHRCNRSS